MAKKTTYSPNTGLIGGAATAYKNWDNVPGMYDGLDKITQAGKDMMTTAFEGYEAEQKRLEKEAKEAKAKQEAIEKEWDAAADQVILSAGSLGDKLYNFTTDEVGADLKKLYLEGVNEKDPKKRREAMRQLQAHSTWIQNHKQMNLDYAHMKKGKNPDGSDNPGMSTYFTKNPKGLEEAHVMTQIMNQKYTHTSRDEETGDIVFHIPAYKSEDGKVNYPAKTITSKQYDDMVIPRNYSITANTEKLQISVNQSEVLDKNAVRQSIENSLPKNDRDFVAGMYDDVSGKNLIKMLNDRGKNLDQEILNAIDSEVWDLDGNPNALNKQERENFIDAVTNPDNEFFNLETSKQIMADQIYNGVVKRHQDYWQAQKNRNRNRNTSTGSQIIYGNANIGDKSFVQQDDILDKAMNNETIYTWGGERFDPDPDNPGNYKLVDSISGEDVISEETGEKVSGPIDAILRSKYFGLNERMNSRKLQYPIGVASVEGGEGDDTEEIPRPSRSIITESFGAQSSKRVINKLTELYKDYPGFTFERSADKQLRILAPDGVTEIFVDMDKSVVTFNAGDSQDKIQNFIKENSKQVDDNTTYTTD